MIVLQVTVSNSVLTVPSRAARRASCDAMLQNDRDGASAVMTVILPSHGSPSMPAATAPSFYSVLAFEVPVPASELLECSRLPVRLCQLGQQNRNFNLKPAQAFKLSCNLKAELASEEANRNLLSQCIRGLTGSQTRSNNTNNHGAPGPKAHYCCSMGMRQHSGWQAKHTAPPPPHHHWQASSCL